ncbi:MAG TPA: hypothetical protein DCZ59_08040 [Bacteroidetes bacterium]|nr:hypothetical protein [Bacteroidota bacterium]
MRFGIFQHVVSTVFGVGLWLCVSTGPLWGQAVDAVPRVRLEASVLWTLGIQAPDFIRDYQGVLGGAASSFGVPIGARASVNQYLTDEISVGVSGGFFRATIRENYTYDPKPPTTPLGPAQNVTQNIEVSTIPVLLNLDLFPARRQFTGYLGVGIGLVFSNVFWSEEIQTSRLLGARRSGTRYNGSLIAPTAKLRAGVSLGFDGSAMARSATGIRIEVGYTFAPLQDRFFAGQFDSFAVPPPQRLGQEYMIDAGGVSIEIGISLLLRQRLSSTAPQSRF